MVQPAPKILTPNPRIQLVNKDGTLTTQGMQLLQQHAGAINGGVPTVPATATHASNVFTLTPYNVSPQFGNYYDFQPFPFMAPANSTGPVTATVVPPTGFLDTLPVYKDNGATQAGNGDIVNGRLYTLTYHSSLNSGNGGFTIA